jgi:hypothetical protein
MERRHFLLRFAQDGWRIKAFGNRLALNLTSQPEIRSVPRIVAFGAVASRFPALARRGSDRASTEIAESDKLAEQLNSLGLQLV